MSTLSLQRTRTLSQTASVWDGVLMSDNAGAHYTNRLRAYTRTVHVHGRVTGAATNRTVHKHRQLHTHVRRRRCSVAAFRRFLLLATLGGGGGAHCRRRRFIAAIVVSAASTLTAGVTARCTSVARRLAPIIVVAIGT